MSIESNIISKDEKILENSYKMGTVDVKSVDTTANVINKVEVNNSDLKLITILISIIFIIIIGHLLYKLYKLHNRCIKKRYQSQANDLDKI